MGAIYVFAAVVVIGAGLIVFWGVRLLRQKRVWAGVVLLAVIALPATQLTVFLVQRELADREWGFRKLLPEGTVEICEWRHEDGFLPDYSYYLRVKISQEDLDSYVKKLGLTPHAAGRSYAGAFQGPSWLGGPAVWWDASPDVTATWVEQPIPDQWTFAKYENGFLYLHSFNH